MVAPEQTQKERFLFPKTRRLLHRSEFLWVQHKGKRYDIGDLIACVCTTPDQMCRVGITTSKKVGNAVIRNRIRRLIREAVRRCFLPQISQGFAVVLIAKKELSMDMSQSQMDDAVQRLVAHIQQGTSSLSSRSRSTKSPSDVSRHR